jgi:aquaporin related protein
LTGGKIQGLAKMNPAGTQDPNRSVERQALGWLPNKTRHLLISFLGEFIGTFLFLFFAFAATQTANNLLAASNRSMDISSLMYISLAFGFSLAVNVWVFFRVSGGLFNPAVSHQVQVVHDP